MPATLMKFPVHANRGGPLLRLVLFALAAFLFLVTVSQEVEAQTNITLNQLIPNLIRNTSQVVTASSAGLQVAEAGSVAIGSGSSMIGSVAINELRVIPLARVAARVATASAPILLTMLAADLIQYGITQCTTSPNGWCKPGSVNANSSDTGFNGYQWYSCAGLFDSPVASGNACIATHPGAVSTGCTQSNAQQWSCVANDSSGNPWFGVGVSIRTTCVKNYVVVNGACVPDPAAQTAPVPATYPDLSDKLAQVLSGNPNRAKDYWGFEPWTEQASWLADPQTQALPAQVVNPANGTVTGPTTTTQTPTGTSTTQTSCTVSPNSDSTSLANKPVSVVCTLKTTNPDGTTSTTTTTTTPTTQDGSNPQPAPVPASSPIPCGLGTAGSPKCLIDETGTPSNNTQVQTDTKTKLDSADASLRNSVGSVTGSGKPDTTIDGILPRFTGQCRTASVQVTTPLGVITQVVDPCPYWDYIQFVMSFIWCFVTALGCIGMVKETIDGG